MGDLGWSTSETTLIINMWLCKCDGDIISWLLHFRMKIESLTQIDPIDPNQILPSRDPKISWWQWTIPQGPASDSASLGDPTLPTRAGYDIFTNGKGLYIPFPAHINHKRNHGFLLGINTHLWDVSGAMIGGWTLYPTRNPQPPDSQQCQQPGMHHGRNLTSASLSACVVGVVLVWFPQIAKRTADSTWGNSTISFDDFRSKWISGLCCVWLPEGFPWKKMNKGRPSVLKWLLIMNFDPNTGWYWLNSHTLFTIRAT